MAALHPQCLPVGQWEDWPLGKVNGLVSRQMLWAIQLLQGRASQLSGPCPKCTDFHFASPLAEKTTKDQQTLEESVHSERKDKKEEEGKNKGMNEKAC